MNIKKHLTAILCAISVLALLFPIITIADYSEATLTGFTAIKKSVFATLLIAFPVALAVSNYVQSLEKYKKLLSVVVPVASLVALVIVVLHCRSVTVKALGGWIDAEEVKIGAGAIFAAVSYVVLGVMGFRTKGVSDASVGMHIPSIDISAIAGNVQEKSAQLADRVKTAASDFATNSMSETAPAKRSISVNRTNEILGLIEKLSAMKEAGVLTEEEFANKKQSLLEEI